MENAEMIRRVARMEAVYNQCDAAVNNLIAAAEQFLAAEPALRELDAYYQSSLWMADFDAERRGEFPQDMNRGILTEDAIWDLLTDEARMRKLLAYIMKET